MFPFTAEFREILAEQTAIVEALKKKEGFVHMSLTGNDRLIGEFKGSWKTAFTATGLPDPTIPHDFRGQQCVTWPGLEYRKRSQ